jgi:NADH-quinone oxidoreductase subunit E
MMSFTARRSADLDQDFVDQVLLRQAGRPGALLGILQAVQDNHPQKYLPRESLAYIAEKANIPPSTIFSVATFFAQFNLEPQGRNTVSVCRGTACHTRGARDLLEQVMMHLGFHAAEDGELDKLALTTEGGGTTLRTVACFGQCALAPVIEVNHAIFGHMNERTLQRELDALDQQEARA